MRFNDEYRKEMNNKRLSEDFIKNLAAKMAEEAEQSENRETAANTKNIEEEIETRVIEYKENKKMTGIKITALAVSAAAVLIVCGTVLNNLKDENIYVTPGSTEITTGSTTIATTAETSAEPKKNRNFCRTDNHFGSNDCGFRRAGNFIFRNCSPGNHI